MKLFIGCLFGLLALPVYGQTSQIETPQPKSQVETPKHESFFKRTLKDPQFYGSEALTTAGVVVLIKATDYTERNVKPGSTDTLGLPYGKSWNIGIGAIDVAAVTGLTFFSRYAGRDFCEGRNGPKSKAWCFVSKWGPAIANTTITGIGAGRRYSSGRDNTPLF